jgi:PAS domain S-box-containing protein
MAELIDKNKHWLILSEATFEGIAVIDKGKIVNVNKQLAGMLGCETGEIIGQDPLDFVAPESHELVLEHRTSKSEAPYEILALRKDGSTFPAEIRRKALPYQERTIKVVVIRDITEYKQVKEQIFRRNRELALLNRVIAASAAGQNVESILETVCRELAQAFDLPHVAAALLDEKKTMATIVAEHLSPGPGQPPAGEALSTLGMTIPLTEDLSFQYLLDYKAPFAVSDMPSEPPLPAIHDLLSQRGVISLLMLPLVIEGEVIGGLGLESLQPRHFSTEEINLAWSVADQVAGVIARSRLDAERRRLEEQYHQSQKMEAVGRLTAGIAHDFNNILTVINGFAALMEYELLPDDPLREMLDKILHSGQRAADLVQQLLAFSRKQVIEPRVLDLNAVVADMDKMLRRVIGEDIDLKTTLTPDLWPVKVDVAQMGQVIVNLAVNARQAMPEGGRLTIETANVVIDEAYVASHLGTQPGKYVLLAISDTGCGMSKEVKARIFEPFFTTKGVGTGLGLATVFGIIKQSGGDIWVYSEEGRGATFKIYLPRADESILPSASPQLEAEYPAGSETVLLVEDDIAVRDLVRQVLQRQGYTLLEAQNGHEALRLINHYAAPVDLLLTDVILPDISGKFLAEAAARMKPDMKILFMSGYTDEAVAHHGVLESGVAFLQKPFGPIALARKVRVVLDN